MPEYHGSDYGEINRRGALIHNNKLSIVWNLWFGYYLKNFYNIIKILKLFIFKYYIIVFILNISIFKL